MKFYLNDQQQKSLITIKGQEIKLTRKEYLRRFAGNEQKNPYNDKMVCSKYRKTTRNYKK